MSFQPLLVNIAETQLPRLQVGFSRQETANFVLSLKCRVYPFTSDLGFRFRSQCRELYLFLIANKLRDHCCTRRRYLARYKVLPFMKEFDLNLRNGFVTYSAVGKYADSGSTAIELRV